MTLASQDWGEGQSSPVCFARIARSFKPSQLRQKKHKDIYLNTFEADEDVAKNRSKTKQCSLGKAFSGCRFAQENAIDLKMTRIATTREKR